MTKREARKIATLTAVKMLQQSDESIFDAPRFEPEPNANMDDKEMIMSQMMWLADSLASRYGVSVNEVPADGELIEQRVMDGSL
jgi:hypothetical protein